MIAIALDGVSHRFGKVTALTDVSLSVAAGETVGLVGPNGAGKSTCLGIMAGLVVPSAGRAELFGNPAGTADVALRRAIGMVPQDPALFGWLTLIEYIEAVVSAYGAVRDGARISALVAGLGLADAAHRPLNGFSRGMQKKTHFAAILAVAPPVLILDEPFDSVDTDAVLFLEDALQTHLSAGGTTVVSTHLLGVAATLCRRVAVLVEGRLAGIVEASAEGGPLSADELKARYRSAVTGQDSTTPSLSASSATS